MKDREKKMELLAQFCEKLGYTSRKVVIDGKVYWEIVKGEVKLNLTTLNSGRIYAFFSAIGGFCPQGTTVREIHAETIGNEGKPKRAFVYLNEFDGITIIEHCWVDMPSNVSDEEIAEFNKAMKEGEDD
jgi:hypothetical protein